MRFYETESKAGGIKYTRERKKNKTKQEWEHNREKQCDREKQCEVGSDLIETGKNTDSYSLFIYFHIYYLYIHIFVIKNVKTRAKNHKFIQNLISIKMAEYQITSYSLYSDHYIVYYTMIHDMANNLPFKVSLMKDFKYLVPGLG